MRNQFKAPRRMLRGNPTRNSQKAQTLATINAAAKRNLRGPAKRPTKRKVPIRKLQALGGEITQSSFRLTRRPTKQVLALKRVGAPNVAIDQTTQILSIAPGFQGVAYDYINNCGYLNNIQLTIPANSASAAPTRFLLESTMCEYAFTNTTTATVEVEIYDIVQRRDLQSQWTYQVLPVGSPGAYTLVLDGNPRDYWNIGTLIGNNEPSTYAGPRPQNILGSSPFDSQLFRDYFTVKKRTRVMLPLGASHRHFVTMKPNLLVDAAVSNAWQYLNGVKGITQWCMFVARGMPQTVGDQANGVSTNEGQVAIVKSFRTKYTWVADTSNTLYYHDNMLSPAATQAINQGSGAPGPVVATAT